MLQGLWLLVTTAPPAMEMGSTLLFLWISSVSKHRQLFLSPSSYRPCGCFSGEEFRLRLLSPLCSRLKGSLPRPLNRVRGKFCSDTAVPILPCVINPDSSVSVGQEPQVRDLMQSTMYPDYCYDYFREKMFYLLFSLFLLFHITIICLKIYF